MADGLEKPRTRASGGVLARALWSGTRERPIYADRIAPASGRRQPNPVVLIHGGCHTGGCYLATPDGRAGWAGMLAQEGYEVFVPDWPGRGRSAPCDDLPTLSTREIASALLALVVQVGPAIVVAHSASGPMAWWLAEQEPASVAAIVGVAPGAPANILPALPDDPAEIEKLRHDVSLGCPVLLPEDRPVRVDREFIRTFWANAPRFRQEGFEAYAGSIFPESARLFNERFNIGGRGLRIRDPRSLARHPILILTGDHDPRHPRAMDEATARYLGAEFCWLPDRGITGNGHMPMIEDNNDGIAALIVEWLREKGLGRSIQARGGHP